MSAIFRQAFSEWGEGGSVVKKEPGLGPVRFFLFVSQERLPFICCQTLNLLMFARRSQTRTETRVKPGPPPAAFLLNRRKVIKTIMIVINEAMTTSLPAARHTSPLIPAVATVVGDWLLEIVFTGPGTELWDS